MSGQLSGQVPNQSSASLPGIPQHSGTSLGTQMQVPVAQRSMTHMDPEFGKARRFMTQKIFEFLSQRLQHAHDMPPRRIFDLVKRLEEALFKNAPTKDEYVNLATLESRLQVFIERLSLSNHNQQFSHINSSSSIGTMIPTPGMPQSGNNSLMGTASIDNQMISGNVGNGITSSTVNSGTFLPASNGLSSVAAQGGTLANGYQQSPSNFTISSGGNNMVTSLGGQRLASQMIPTPGFNNTNSDTVNNGPNNQTYVNLDSSNIMGAFSSVESTVVSQPQQHKHHGGQNSRILHSLGSHMGGGMRSGLQQKSYASSNGTLNGGLGMMANNLHMVNGPGASEGYLTGTMYGNPSRSLQPTFDHNQQTLIQGDGYTISTADSSGSGNLYAPATSVGSVMNNQNMNAVTLQSMPKTNSQLMSTQSNLSNSQQVASLKSHSIDQTEKNFQSQHALAENHVRSHPQQLPQQSHQFPPTHLVQQRQHKQQVQHQLLSKTDTFSRSQLTTDLGSVIKSEPGLEHREETLNPPVSEQFQFSETQNQFANNSLDDHSRGAHLLSFPSGTQDMCASLSRTSEQMQQFIHPSQFVADSQSDFSCLHGGVPSDAVVQGQWYPKSQDGSHAQGNFPPEQNVQEEFLHRITGRDEAQQNNLSSDGSVIVQSIASSRSDKPSNIGGAVCKSSNLSRDRQFFNQQRWLLFLRHARRCPAPEGKCPDSNCIHVQNLLKHMEKCDLLQCPYPRCCATKILISHHRRCKDSSCPVCIPVKKYLQAQANVYGRPPFGSGFTNSFKGPLKSYDTGENPGRSTLKTVVETPEALQPSLKRMKIEQSSQAIVHEIEDSGLTVPAICESQVLQDTLQVEQKANNTPMMKLEVGEVKMELSSGIGQGSPKGIVMRTDNLDDSFTGGLRTDTIVANNPTGLVKEENIKIEKDIVPAKQEDTLLNSDSASGSKSGKSKIKGVSLTELFTPEQVREHILGLRQWVGQSKAKAEKNQAMEHSMSENSCQLCAVEKLTFEPPPIYCTPCGARIKRNVMYYTFGTGDTRHYLCIPCYNEARGDTILVDGTNVLKARLEKKKNDEETEEWWVQCDKCEAWQHQICALFNGRRNEAGQAEYTCPNCYIAEVERGERKPLPQSAVLGAKDLPRTILSDHIEQRLAKRLKLEKQERARVQGKNIDEIPGADGLVVRVVSSVDKKLEVKSRFLEIFQEENYPSEFPYKSKVLLLFQKIEGVEVCLFGMYVQEFGSECQQPNHRRVYLSYLDSVKYFRPEVKTVSGEALRTYVYHEILIGYLEYCKKRGFTSCYIWACPPLKGEDYILYCHPEIQKTPKSDKLREWYLSMLRKAAKENVVVDLTNLYDHFFVTAGECKAKVTAARLPYFDGDYWPGAAEDMIYQLQQEEDGRKQHKKGIIKKSITKRALKASGQTDLSGNASKDLLLMHKLGETICPMKEDFIMVHLQHACTHCCILMVSGNRWVCNQCKNFQLCDRCYESEQKLDVRERHPINQKDKHVLYPVENNDVPVDTKDRDEILESEFFDTRQAFLSLCQGNHYQYDTLRRAKHSSMMVLYHLHNPTAPAFVTTCNVCHLDIEAGQGWRCEVCPEYDVCNTCYQKDGGVDHPHKLTNHPSADPDAQNQEARQQRVLQLRKMLDLLVHASQCRSPQCLYPNCRKVKGLFRHGMQCKVRASGGCVLCKRMWYLLQIHARACKESECHVPRCRDLKDHFRKQQQQSDSRRRAAVMEMMRQRAAEVAGNAG